MPRHTGNSFVLLVMTSLLIPAVAQAGAERPVIDLWPGKAPSETTEIGREHLQENKPGQLDVKRLTNVSKPTLTLYKAPKESNTGGAVIVAPGGGFSILAIEHEGTQVCEWLNSIGVNAVLLKYRVPRRPDQPREGAPLHALQDAQRAVGVVRGRAAEWGIDPKRIGVLGFSAGAHLAAAAATNYDKRAYDAVDSADETNCRPDFAVLIYAGGMLNAERTALLPHLRVTAQTPPMFFAHAHDDPVPAENSVHLYLALKQNKVPAELHIYARGGHGFGMHRNDNPTDAWPQRCAEWMKAQGLLAAAK